MRNFRRLTVGLCALVLAGTAQTALATPITSSADPALVGGTLVDFNSAPLSSFASQVFGGVTITGVGGDLRISNDSNGVFVPPTPSGDQFLDNMFGGPTFQFTFSSLISAFGMQIGATNAVQQLTAYDALNNIIEVVTIPDQVSTLPFPYTGYYGIAAPGIAWVTLTGNLDDWVVVDDLTYNGGGTTVPEPASLLLFGAGLVGLRAWRKRQ